MIFKQIRTLLFLVGCTVLSACVDLGFRNPQPEGVADLSEFPDELTGIFANKEDTLIVTPKLLVSGNDSTVIAFSDTVRLRKYKGWYFLNITEKKQNYWTVVAARRVGNRLIVKIPEIESEDQKDIEKKWDVELEYSDLDNVSAFIIDPEKEEWSKLLRSRFFAKSKFRKISD